MYASRRRHCNEWNFEIIRFSISKESFKNSNHQSSNSNSGNCSRNSDETCSRVSKEPGLTRSAISRKWIAVVAHTHRCRIKYFITVNALPPRTLRSFVLFERQQPIKCDFLGYPIVIKIKSTSHSSSPRRIQHPSHGHVS